MPIYEYGCESCEHTFEMIQRIGAAPPEACPSCGQGAVRKLISRTSFRLEGSGWYKDGYGLGGRSSSGGGSTVKPTAKEESKAKAAAK